MWCVPASLSNTAMASPSWSFSGKKKKRFFFFFFSQTHEAVTQRTKSMKGKLLWWLINHTVDLLEHRCR